MTQPPFVKDPARTERLFFRLGAWAAIAWWLGAAVYVISKIRAAESQRALSPQVWDGVVNSVGLAFAGSVVTFIALRILGRYLSRR